MCELLAPAGSYESIIAAVNAGADAVYTGGCLFGARAFADNPDEEHLIRGLEYCHLHGRKLYLTVNTLLREEELETMLYPYLLPYYENGIDGLIVQDFGVMRFVRACFPDLPVHASTQMTVTGSDGARLLQKEGVSRVVAARELSLEEIRAMIDETGIEVEAFVHGAMCYSYSGQCLFSSFLGGRSGNRGRCAQPCRLPYRLRGAHGPAEYLLSMKDMCTLDLLPELLDAGISSLKIEGRMKRPEYTAGVVCIYRKYLDLYKHSSKKGYHVEDADRGILLDLYNRGGFSDGYYHAHNGRHMMSMKRPNHRGTEAVRFHADKRGRRSLTAIEPLGRGDVIELAPGTEVTLGENVKKGDPVRIPYAGIAYPENGVFYRTRNARLLEQLKEQYLDGMLKEKIAGELVITANAPAVLRLECADVRVSCSQRIAETARNQPTDAETVRRQLQKTGNTPFEFQKLDVSLEEGLFIPIAGLNELRRAGLQLLQEELLRRSRRRSARTAEKIIRSHTGAGDEMIASSLNILVTTEAQLDAVLESAEPEIDTVYLDSMIFGILQNPGHESGSVAQLPGPEQERAAEQIIERVKHRARRCFLNCPAVLRDRERAFLSGDLMRKVMRRMDGFLLHTVDELAYFREYVRETGTSAILAADDNLYAYNRRSEEFLSDQGIERFTLPVELNFRELTNLNRKCAELTVYGYQALMQSAQCVVKNTAGCTGIPEITYLRDRRNIGFPVLNRCPFCCNTVYNSVPLMLCGCQKEIACLAPAYLRLSFTIESKEETAQAVRLCIDFLEGRKTTQDTKPVWTKGHFKKGVE